MRDFMLIIHFIGLTMALGAGFANLSLGIVASKLSPAERGSFMSKTMILGRVSQIGLLLLILSGFYLINPYWGALGSMTTFIIKLSLVGLLLIMVGIILFLIRKSRKENNPALLAKIRPLGIINFILGITIVIFAVLTFH